MEQADLSYTVKRHAGQEKQEIRKITMDKPERVIEFLAAVEYTVLEHLIDYPAGGENIRVEVPVPEQQILRVVGDDRRWLEV